MTLSLPTFQLKRSAIASVMAITIAAMASTGCTFKVAAPEKPITINLNVKIEHEVRGKVEKDLEQLFEDESDLF